MQLEVRQDESHHNVNRSKTRYCVHRHYQLSILLKITQIILFVNIICRNWARSTIRSWAPEATIMFRYIHSMPQVERLTTTVFPKPSPLNGKLLKSGVEYHSPSGSASYSMQEGRVLLNQNLLVCTLFWSSLIPSCKRKLLSKLLPKNTRGEDRDSHKPQWWKYSTMKFSSKPF